MTDLDFDSLEGQKAVADAVAMVMKLASRPALPGDAARFLSKGGVTALPDRQYVEEFLDVVNQNQRFGHANSLAAVTSERKPVTTFFPRESLDPLIEMLERIRIEPRAVCAEWTPRWRKILDGRTLSIGLADGDRTLVVGDAAAYTHVLRVLTQAPFCDELCRCELPTCLNFFLYQFDRNGPPPGYCIHDGATCRAQAKQQKNLDRKQAQRAGMSVADFRIFKETGKKPRRRK